MALTPQEKLLRASGYYSEQEKLLRESGYYSEERPEQSFIGPPAIDRPSVVPPPPERSPDELRAEAIRQADEHRARVREGAGISTSVGKGDFGLPELQFRSTGETLPEYLTFGGIEADQPIRNVLRGAGRATAETALGFVGGFGEALGKAVRRGADEGSFRDRFGDELFEAGGTYYSMRDAIRQSTAAEMYDDEGNRYTAPGFTAGQLGGGLVSEGAKYYAGGGLVRGAVGGVVKAVPALTRAGSAIASKLPSTVRTLLGSAPVKDVLAFLPVDYITTQRDEDSVAYMAEMFSNEEFRESFKENPDKAWGLFSGDRGQKALELINVAASKAMQTEGGKLAFEGTFGFAADLGLRAAGKGLAATKRAALDPAGVSGLDPEGLIRSTDDVEMHSEARLAELSNRVEALKDQRLKRDVEGGESVAEFQERRKKHWDEIDAAEAQEAAAWDEFSKADVNITESADEAVERGVDGEQKLKGRPQREQPSTNEEKYYYLDDPESVERMGPIERRIENARAWMLKGDKPYAPRSDDRAEEVFYREHPALTRAMGPTLAGATLGGAAPAETTEERIGNVLKGAALTAGMLYGSKQIVDVATGARIVDPNTLITGVPPTKPPSAKDAPVKPVENTIIHGLLNNTESLLDAAGRRIIKGSNHLISAVGHALKERAEKMWGGRTLDISHDGKTGRFTSEDDVDLVVEMGMAEIVRALSKEGNAAEWYQADLDEAYAITMRGLHEKHGDAVLRNGEADPEIAESLRVALAIMSDGQGPRENLDHAVKQMDHYIENGVFSVELGAGNNASKMNDNFAVVNEMVERFGTDNAYRFLNSEVTIKQLKDAGYDAGGELMTQAVKASAIFGPKVGGGFFPNVGGDLDPLTMDRWFMRWLGRLTGDIMVDPTDATKKSGREALLKALSDDKIDFDPKVDADGKKLGEAEQVKRITAKAREIHKEWEAKWRESSKDNRPVKPEFVKKAQTHIGHVDGMLRDSPKNAGDRAGHRKIMRRIQEGLEADGHGRHEIATLKALVWFPEKELYGKLGVPGKKDWTFSSAAKEIFGDLEGIPIKQETLDGKVRGEVDGTGSVDEAAQIRQASFRGLAGKEGTPFRVPLEEQQLRGILNESAIAHRREALIRLRESQGLEGNFNGGMGRTPKRLLGAGQKEGEVQIWKVTKPTKNAFGRLVDSPALAEITDGQVFHDMIAAAMKEHRTGSSVEVYKPEEYNGMRLFLTLDGKAGYALNGDDIVSVFKAPETKGRRGWSAYALAHAVEMGGRRLDAFDTRLPELYAMGGFEATGRVAFNDAVNKKTGEYLYAPKNWDPKQYSRFRGLHGEAGKPDIITMVYNPKSLGKYKRGDGQVFDDYGDMLADAAEKAGGKQTEIKLDDTRVNVGEKEDWMLHSARPIGGALGGAALGAASTDAPEERGRNVLMGAAAGAGLLYGFGRLKGYQEKHGKGVKIDLEAEQEAKTTASDEFIAAIKKEMEAENVTIETGRKAETPTKDTTPVLPPALSKAAPRYRSASLKFESDIDRAAYIVRNRDKRSQGDQKYVEWLEANGVSETEAVQLGNKIANSLKGLYEDGAEEIVVAADADMNARFRPPPSSTKPADARDAEDIDPNEFVNIKKLVGDGSERLQARMEQETRNVVVRHKMDPKLVGTHAETIAAAESLGLDAQDIARVLKEGRVTGVEMLAARNLINATSERIGDLYEFLAKKGETITDAEVEAVHKEIDLLETDEDLLLRTYLPASSETGRTLNAMKIAARNKMDAATWMKRAAKISGTTELPDAVKVEIRKLIKGHKDNPTDPRHKAALLKLMNELHKASVPEQIVAFGKAALLSAPTTQMVNIVSTGTHLVFKELMAQPAAVAADVVLSTIKGTERTKHLSSFKRIRQSAADGAQKGYEAAKAIFQGDADIDDTLRRLDAGYRETNFDLWSRGANAIPTKLKWERATSLKIPEKLDYVTNKFMNTVFKTLGMADQFFSEISFRMSLDEQARVMAFNEGLSGQALLDRADEILAKETSLEMMAQALDHANIVTFRNKGAIAEGLTNIKSGLKRRYHAEDAAGSAGVEKSLAGVGYVVGEALMPFTYTPSNVLTRAIEMSPLGVAMHFGVNAKYYGGTVMDGVNKMFGVEVTSKKSTKKQRKMQKDLAEALGTATAGTLSLTMLGVYLYNKGLVTTHYTSEKYGQRQVTGERENSIKFMGQWVDLNRVAPLGTTVLMGAQMARAMDPSREDIIRGVEPLGFVDQMAQWSKSTVSGAGAWTYADAFVSMTRTVLDMSAMEGVRGGLERIASADSDRGVELATRGLLNTPVKMLIPNIIKRIRRSMDPNSYVVEGVADQFRNILPGGKFPWEAEGLTQRIDPFGEPIKMNSGFRALFDPFNSMPDKTNDPVRAMIRELDININLLRRDRETETAREFQERAERTGQVLYDVLEGAMKERAYHGARDTIDDALVERPDIPDVVRQAMAEEMQAQFIKDMIARSRRISRRVDAEVQLADPVAAEREVREGLETKLTPMGNVMMMRRNAEQRRQLQGPPR